MHDSDRTASQRWGSQDLTPGSASHETLILPTFLPGAARPYVLPGMLPGTGALDNLPWAKPYIRGMREMMGINLISSTFSLAYEHSNLGIPQDEDEPTVGSAERVPEHAATTATPSDSTHITTATTPSDLTHVATAASPSNPTHTAAAATPSDPAHSAVANNLQMTDGPPTNLPSRVRIIEPITIHPQILRDILPRSPTPATPTPSQPQSTQDPINGQGVSIDYLILPLC